MTELLRQSGGFEGFGVSGERLEAAETTLFTLSKDRQRSIEGSAADERGAGLPSEHQNAVAVDVAHSLNSDLYVGRGFEITLCPPADTIWSNKRSLDLGTPRHDDAVRGCLSNQGLNVAGIESVRELAYGLLVLLRHCPRSISCSETYALSMQSG